MGEEERDELVELSLRGADAIERADLEEIRELIHPDCEFHSRLAATEGRVYHGIVGMERYFRDMQEAWSAVEREVLTVERIGENTVLSSARMNATGRGSGIEFHEVFWTVTWFEDRLVRRVDSFLDRDTAYAAARG